MTPDPFPLYIVSMKIWIKTYVGDRIADSAVIEKRGEPSREAFEEALREAGLLLDLPTPVVLDAHYGHFTDFNAARFLPADFMEPVSFDSMVAELLPS